MFHEKDGGCGDTLFCSRGVFELEEKLRACIIRFCRPGALGTLVHWYLYEVTRYLIYVWVPSHWPIAFEVAPSRHQTYKPDLPPPISPMFSLSFFSILVRSS